MKLYTYFRSSASFRVRIALNVKAIDWEPAYVNLKAGEQKGDYKRTNPQGLIPYLEDSTNGISQSLAILEYIEERYPEPALLPSGLAARAQVRAMAQLVACDIHPLNNLRVLNYLKTRLDHDQETTDRWYRHWINEGFAALEGLVAKYGSMERCFGAALTMADCCLVPQIWNARRFNTDLEPFPRLVAIDKALASLPAFRNAAPETQPDNPQADH